MSHRGETATVDSRAKPKGFPLPFVPAFGRVVAAFGSRVLLCVGLMSPDKTFTEGTPAKKTRSGQSGLWISALAPTCKRRVAVNRQAAPTFHYIIHTARQTRLPTEGVTEYVCYRVTCVARR